MTLRDHCGLIVIFLALLAMTGCASSWHRCTPLRVDKVTLGGKTIYIAVCPEQHMSKVCKTTGTKHANACTYTRGHSCWIFAEDSEAGAKASFHELEHCAGGDEKAARMRDWPGTVAPLEDSY